MVNVKVIINCLMSTGNSSTIKNTNSKVFPKNKFNNTNKILNNFSTNWSSSSSRFVSPVSGMMNETALGTAKSS